MGDGQAQAGAGLTGATPGAAALEGQKHALQVGRRNTDASVDDPKARHLATMIEHQRDAAAIGKAHRIAQQIDQDLPQAPCIGAHIIGNAAFGLQFEGQAFGGSLRCDHADHIVEELMHRQRRDIQAQFAGLDTGQIEQAFDQPAQMLAALVDGLHRGAPLALHLRVFEHDLRIAEDAVERRSQLMGHAGHITGLGLVGCLRNFLGGLQFDIGAPVSLDLAHQQMVLAVRLVFGHAPALAAEHDPPGAHRCRQRQQREGLHHCGGAPCRSTPGHH